MAGSARPRLLDLPADPDPLVRREATAKAADGIRHPDAVAALWRRWQVEADRVTRWDLVQAFGAVRPAGVGTPMRAELHRLRGMAGSGDDWTRVEAAHALWRVTGDPAEAVPP
ncbi:HEAT repeat domain-containing protein [Actinosynnema sp. NPDC091369]